VVYLLASLPESYQVLVTALEANADVPLWETVTERLLAEERKKTVPKASKDSPRLTRARRLSVSGVENRAT
jgi:hypothetical protein